MDGSPIGILCKTCVYHKALGCFKSLLKRIRFILNRGEERITRLVSVGPFKKKGSMLSLIPNLYFNKNPTCMIKEELKIRLINLIGPFLQCVCINIKFTYLMK